VAQLKNCVAQLEECVAQLTLPKFLDQKYDFEPAAKLINNFCLKQAFAIHI
jgi:hypothetical protein